MTGSNGGPMTIRILDDGSVKIETSKVSPAAHVRAERFLGEVTRILGGTQDRKTKHGHHHHGHGDHEHDHAHDGDHEHH